MKIIEFLISQLKEDKRLYDMWVKVSTVSQISQIAVWSLVSVVIHTVLIVIWKQGSFKNYPLRIKVALICCAVQAPFATGIVIALWVQHGEFAPLAYDDPAYRILISFNFYLWTAL